MNFTHESISRKIKDSYPDYEITRVTEIFIPFKGWVSSLFEVLENEPIPLYLASLHATTTAEKVALRLVAKNELTGSKALLPNQLTADFSLVELSE